MIKYDTCAVTPVNGAEVMHTSPLVTGVQGKNRVVTGIYASPTDTIQVRVYADQELIADIDTEAFDGGGFMPLDIPLGPGVQCKVGLYSTTGTTAQDITIQWKE